VASPGLSVTWLTLFLIVTVPKWLMTSSLPTRPRRLGSSCAMLSDSATMIVAIPPRMPSTAEGVVIVTTEVWLIWPPT